MNEQKHVSWLLQTLPTWVSEGLMPPEVAERLRRRYEDQETERSGARWATALFSVIGATLIGSGMILLLAHNWEQFSRPMRAAIGFLPLLSCQVLAGALLLRNVTSLAWREGVGAGWALSVGGTIALIGQTYHLPGGEGSFLLIWSLLGLPVAYLLKATLPAMLYMIGITVWSASMLMEYDSAFAFWPLLALALPLVWVLCREDRYQARSSLLCWALSIALAVGTGVSCSEILDEALWFVILYSGLFSVFLFAGQGLFGQASSAWRNPFGSLGAAGIACIALALSFTGVWEEMQPRSLFLTDQATSQDFNVALALQCMIALAWPLAGLAFWGSAWRRKDPVTCILGAMPALTALGCGLAIADAEILSCALFNLYVLVISIALIAIGARDRGLATVNLGMLFLSLLILCRFFDAEISFVLKGAAFIALGIGFLATNLVLIRRKGRTL